MFNLYGINKDDLYTIKTLLEAVYPKVCSPDLRKKIDIINTSIEFALKEKKDYD